MADDTTPGAENAGDDEGTFDINAMGGLRDRMGRARFREQVREGLEAELKAKAKTPKKAGFKATEVPSMMQEVTDADIDNATNRVTSSQGQAVPGDSDAEATGDAEAKGPIRDWFAANPELVQAVVAFLLKLILGT